MFRRSSARFQSRSKIFSLSHYRVTRVEPAGLQTQTYFRLSPEVHLRMSVYVVEEVTQSFTHCLEHNWIISAWLLSSVTQAYIKHFSKKRTVPSLSLVVLQVFFWISDISWKLKRSIDSHGVRGRQKTFKSRRLGHNSILLRCLHSCEPLGTCNQQFLVFISVTVFIGSSISYHTRGSVFF